MYSTPLDATPAHCLPPSSAISSLSGRAAHLDLRRAIVPRRQPIFSQFVPAPKAPWQPCPGAIGGQEEGLEASHGHLCQFPPTGQLSSSIQPRRAVWLPQGNPAHLEI